LRRLFDSLGRTKTLYVSIAAALIALCLIAMFWYNHEPMMFDPVSRGQARAAEKGHQPVTGYTTTAALIETVDVLLNKRGGYLSNDIMPPWVFLDNVPNWEFGAITQVRDLARAMRNDFSRSQTQSTEDPDLTEADPLFHYDSERWIPPATEGRYKKGRDARPLKADTKKAGMHCKNTLTAWQTPAIRMRSFLPGPITSPTG
jgi:hypothetical protein